MAASAASGFGEVLSQLEDEKLIKRQVAVQRLKKILKDKGAADSETVSFEASLIALLNDSKGTWQSKHGAFLAAEGMLQCKSMESKNRESILKLSLDYLEHKEYRVRLVVAAVLQALAEVDGITIWLKSKEKIYKSIHRNFKRDVSAVKIENKSKFLLPAANLIDLVKSDSVENKAAPVALPTATLPSLGTSALPSLGAGVGGKKLATKKPIGGKIMVNHQNASKKEETAKSGSAPEIVRPSVKTRVSKPAELTRWKAELREQMHDTEGWKSLETSFGALRAIITGAKEQFSKYVDDELLKLLEHASMHTNRFVREISFHTAAAIATSCDIETLKTLAERTCTLLAKGLSDNWSQVRYASSIATRHMLTRAIKNGFAEKYLPILLPPMCINRYYVAQGVRIYSQESWRLAMGTNGAKLVAEHIDKVVAFYVAQAGADNHAVREAACACITELAKKVERKAVSPHVDKLLDTLIDCFKDDSWPVRDAACSACGDFILAYPEESEPKMKKLYKLWFEHLQDSIPTVREDAAVALAKAVKAYGKSAESEVCSKLVAALPAVKEQPNDSKRLGGMENVTQFGVARRVTGKEALANSDQQMYSCGSLAPKMKKRGAGCMDHSFQRLAEPWEITDGAVYLMRELAPICKDAVASQMASAAELIALRNYGHHVYLKQTFWKSVPAIAKGLGKRPFKRVLEPLLEPLFDTLVCNHRLAAHAAADCIGFLNKYLGNLVFTGRLSEDMKAKLRRSDLVSIKLDGL